MQCEHTRERENKPAHSDDTTRTPNHLLVHGDVGLPLQHLLGELDQEHRLARPHLLDRPLGAGPAPTSFATTIAPTAAGLGADAVRRDAGGEAGAVAHALDHAGHVGGAVELGHFARHAQVRVDERLVVDDHVLVGRLGVARLLEAVRLPPEQVRPQLDLDEVQQRDDVARAELRAGRLAVEEEVEELEADGVALEVESVVILLLLLLLLSVCVMFMCAGRSGQNEPLFQILDPRHPLLRIADHLGEQVGKARLAQLRGPRPVQGPAVDGLAVGGIPQADDDGAAVACCAAGGVFGGAGGFGRWYCGCHCLYFYFFLVLFAPVDVRVSIAALENFGVRRCSLLGRS